VTPILRRTSRLRLLAWAGVALLALGAVGPLVDVRLVGRLTAWSVRPGSALVIAGFSVLAAALVQGGRLRWAWVAGLLAVATALWAVGQVRPLVADPETALGAGGIGVRRASIALLTGEMGVGWGLAVLVCGALALILAGGLDAAGASADGDGSTPRN
jgi:hypothetical protein